MRGLVLMLAVLAGLKIWVQDSLFRSGAETAILAAYRERAVATCLRQTQTERRSKPGLTADTVDWTTAEAVRLSVGSRNVDVHLWDVDNALWNARYKNPYLVLASPDPALRLACEYDIMSGTATLGRL